MTGHPAIADWIKQARAERVMTRNHVADLFGVTVEDVKAWETGAPVPEPLLFPLTRWLETGYLPDGAERLSGPYGYPWVINPRA